MTMDNLSGNSHQSPQTDKQTLAPQTATVPFHDHEWSIVIAVAKIVVFQHRF